MKKFLCKSMCIITSMSIVMWLAYAQSAYTGISVEESYMTFVLVGFLSESYDRYCK